MPRLPNPSPVYVLKRKAIAKAQRELAAKEPAPVPVVKVRMAKRR